MKEEKSLRCAKKKRKENKHTNNKQSNLKKNNTRKAAGHTFHSFFHLPSQAFLTGQTLPYLHLHTRILSLSLSLFTPFSPPFTTRSYAHFDTFRAVYYPHSDSQQPDTNTPLTHPHSSPNLTVQNKQKKGANRRRVVTLPHDPPPLPPQHTHSPDPSPFPPLETRTSRFFRVVVTHTHSNATPPPNDAQHISQIHCSGGREFCSTKR